MSEFKSKSGKAADYALLGVPSDALRIKKELGALGIVLSFLFFVASWVIKIGIKLLFQWGKKAHAPNWNEVLNREAFFKEYHRSPALLRSRTISLLLIYRGGLIILMALFLFGLVKLSLLSILLFPALITFVVSTLGYRLFMLRMAAFIPAETYFEAWVCRPSLMLKNSHPFIKFDKMERVWLKLAKTHLKETEESTIPAENA